MKKIIILFIAFMAINSYLYAQSVAINTTGNPADASAILDITSSSKGILIPRMADHTSVSSPVKGVLVFDTTTNTFWFYNGSAWAQISAGGGCTLDQAYDFGGAGNGRTITVSDGAVEFNSGTNTAHFINAGDVANFTNGSDIVSLIGTGNSVANISTSNKESALTVTNSKTTSYAINSTNTGTGNSIAAENTNTSNIYNAIEGISNYGSTSAGNYPAGVAGYFSGSGMGVGVWGQSDGNGTSAGAGVYGNATNNNFGVKAYSSNYPGLNVATGSTNQAAQISSGSASYSNPALYTVGEVQIDCSSTPLHIKGASANDPGITPNSGDYGAIGTSAYYWYQVYTDKLYYKVASNFKSNYSNFDENMYSLIMNDIDNIKPVFYRPERASNNIVQGQEMFYQPNLSLGINTSDAPDYILDNSFSMISASGLSSLAIVAVKYNREEIKELKKTISDFGIIRMRSNRTWVDFEESFSSRLNDNDVPTVTLTTNSSDVKVYILNQNNRGFEIVSTNISRNATIDLTINWIAMAKVSKQDKNNVKKEILPELYNQIVVPPNIKEKAIQLQNQKQKQKPMKLIGNNNPKIRQSSNRVK